MQSSSLFAVLAAVLVAGSGATRLEANPLEKVLELMGSLSAKIAKEGEAGAKAYKEFADWCGDATASKKLEIKTATAQKAKLEAVVAKTTADAGAAQTKIEELAGSISTTDKQLQSAKDVRTKEAADFQASEAELIDTIDTLSRTLGVLEREMAKNPAALAQMDWSSTMRLTSSLGALVDAAAFSSADKQKLLALVQSQEGDEAGDMELGAPAAASYKSGSSGIVDVLEDLKEKAEEELASIRKAEANAKHNFAMLAQSLKDQSKADNKDLQDEKAAKAAAEEGKATATGDLTETTKDLKEGETALELAKENCMQTAADHEASVQARAEELKVIAQAKKILKDSAGGAASQAYALVQLRRAGMRTGAKFAARAEITGVVRKLAKEHHSAALAQLASQIAAVMKMGAVSGEEPFGKVKGLISDLISKLQAEADSQAEEKAYCDEEMKKTEEQKGELEDDASRLVAKIDQAAARSAALKGSARQMQDDLANLAKQQAEMDAQRQDAHKAYVQAMTDLEAGLQGVRQAIGVLRDFYGSRDSSAALLQSDVSLADEMRQPAMPASHKKASGAGSSIIGILEVMESDFAKSLAVEGTEEDSAQAEYKKMTEENKVTKADKDQDVKYQTKEFTALDKRLSDLASDRDTLSSELSAVLEYYAKIKERCIAKPDAYEERKARREAEIKGLREALAALQDETALVQRGKRASAGQRFLGVGGQ